MDQELGSGLVYWGFNDGLFVRRDTGYQAVLADGRPIIAYALAPTVDGIWAATLTQGLVLCRDGKVVRVMDERQGLPDQAIRTLIAHDSLLIFGTDQFLCRLDLTTNALGKISRSSGFNPTDINQMTVAGERIWVGTTTGIVYLPLDFGEEDGVPAPPVRIGKVQVGDKEWPLGEDLDLPAGHAPLHVTFEGVSFNSRGGFSFSYRIPSMDSTWLTTSAAANEVIFTALPAGEHELEVVTVDEQGRRSDRPAVLRFWVASPVFLRPWFIILMALILVGITIGIVQWRNQIQRRKDRLQYAMVASQLTALKAQMNPHFLFNSLNSIQDLVLSKDIRNSNLYLSKFSTLMRRVLSASGQDWVTIGDEVEMLQLYLELEQLRFGDDFSFEVRVDGSEDATEAQIPTMVLQPFVENAIKHGLLHKRGSKRLDVRFEVSESGAVVSITDNGVGRKRSAEIKARSSKPIHQSFSTSATNKRLDLIRQMHGPNVSLNIEDLEENGEAAGTRVVLRLPVG
ncbi:MAG: histidine kinase [Bacteroidia bacterium]